MNDARQYTVMLIEDDVAVRNSYQSIVASTKQFILIGAFESYEEAFEQITIDPPDIVLMDISLCGINGIDATRLLKSQYPTMDIIMVSVHEDNEYVFNALKNGASGYISKSSTYHDLLFALNEVARGGAPMSTRIARMIVEDFHVDTQNSPLAKRETEILKLLSHGKTYTQIADELVISRDTVRTHLRNIYRKLHVNKKSEAIQIGRSKKFI